MRVIFHGRHVTAIIFCAGINAMPYKVKLEAFEGPLDLLLFLIKKDEVDIYDIPIASMTRQFLEYIEIIQLLDLEAASDFILMAATLMRIKAQMLLPKPEIDAETEEIEDPRQELVQRLLEYKRFKQVAEKLSKAEGKAKKLYKRGNFKFEDSGYEYIPDPDGQEEVTLFDLVGAFRKMLEKRNKKLVVHRVEEVTVTIDDRVEYIMSKLKSIKEILFSKLFDPKDPKIVWIVTFIAVLEMTKRKLVRPVQAKAFDEITLVKVNG